MEKLARALCVDDDDQIHVTTAMDTEQGAVGVPHGYKGAVLIVPSTHDTLSRTNMLDRG